jgi:glycerophosphoryl diester phosphodiesterase
VAGSRPRVIAHRGASGYRPDHTLAAYELAIAQGADVIEPDLVATKDGVLVARHEHDLTATTDVAAKYPTRRTTKRVDGREVTGFFTEDFTLEELRTLRARQPVAGRPHDLDDQLPIATFDEICALAVGRAVRIEPETKHPSHFHALGLPLEPPMLASLARFGLLGPATWVQSFEAANLVQLRAATSLSLLRLLDAGDDASLADPAAIAAYAHGVGVHTSHLVDAEGRDRGVVPRLRAAGLEVHVYTFRDDKVSAWAKGDPVAELRRFAELGVDAVFADHPDTAVRALRG